MSEIINYFASSPEAIATLLVAFISSLVTLASLLYALFANHPILVRYLGSNSLVYVDSGLRNNIKVRFELDDISKEIHELRQMDFEILNSHPKKRAENRTVTIVLPDADIQILGITAANSDNRTPRLGGRSIAASIQDCPAEPYDPLINKEPATTFPAAVIGIPHLERSLDKDRVLVRITYDGPYVLPQVQGAKMVNVKKRALAQFRTFVKLGYSCMTVGIIIWLFIRVTYCLLPPLLYRSFYCILVFFVALGVISIALVAILMRRGARGPRPFTSPLQPSPFEQEELSSFHYYDCLRSQHDSQFDASSFRESASQDIPK